MRQAETTTQGAQGMTPDGHEERLAGVEARLAVVETRVTDILERAKIIESAVLEIRLCRARDEWKDRILWLVIGVAVPSVLAIMAAAARTAILSPASQLTP